MVKQDLRLTLLGRVAAIIAFVSLALPWSTLTYYFDGARIYYFFPWGIMTNRGEVGAYNSEGYLPPRESRLMRESSLMIYVALVFIVISGSLGFIGSGTAGKRGKMFLGVAGIFALLSMPTFAAGLQGTQGPTYFSFGFPLPLVTAILSFVAHVKHPNN